MDGTTKKRGTLNQIDDAVQQMYAHRRILQKIAGTNPLATEKEKQAFVFIGVRTKQHGKYSFL
jgi:hypothetical protein